MMEQHPVDTPVFNATDFSAQLTQGAKPLPLFKQALKDGDHFLTEQFRAGGDIEDIVKQRGQLIDQLLTFAWQRFIDTEDFSLVAVGGYGRDQLLLASDIDLMILHKPGISQEDIQPLESFITFLWDFGLEVGHSVRTPEDCYMEAKDDLTVITNMMESRLLCGNKALYEEMRKLTTSKKLWSPKKFFEGKVEEQKQRHGKLSESEHRLEPNVKESPGGLRDIQTISWVAKRHFDNLSLSGLLEHDFLTEEEYQTLKAGRNLLWRIRFALHMTTGRREDRLLFEFQKGVAELLGFKSDDNKGVEAFMKMYFRAARETTRLNDMLLQHFEEEIIYSRRKERIVAINARFQKRHDYIEVIDDNVFKRYPSALLEIFLLIQKDPSIVGVRASTIRLIRNHLYLIDDEFRQDIRNRSLFMEIIKQPNLVGHKLRLMHRYGILAAYIPVFAKIEGLMQFDLFHVFTVDEHILTVVRNMRLFGLAEYRKQFPGCHSVIKQLPKLELLYIAGLFHDIAKGRGGDHSKLGAKDALAFCKLHQLSDYDAKLVAWLIEKHLLMSKTAQREDIDDPDTIINFADKVRDQNHLNYLYVLTVADICGTNPDLWNSWKATLMTNLYQRTLQKLRLGKEKPILIQKRIQDIKQEVQKMLDHRKYDEAAVAALWKTLGNDYFLRHQPDEIAWHAKGILGHKDISKPLVMVANFVSRGGCLIFLYMRDKKNIFSATTGAIERLGLNVLDARIITSHRGFTLDTYVVLENNGEMVSEKDRIREIRTNILSCLESPEAATNDINRIENRQLKSFTIPTHVSFDIDDKNKRTVMEVSTMDRPGVLSRIGTAMAMCETRLQGAKIATYGERVEDIFYLRDNDNKPITDNSKFECLKKSIVDILA